MAEASPGLGRAGAAVVRRWRILLAVALVVGGAAVPWVLVADVHRSVTWTPVGTGPDREPDAVAGAVVEQLRAVDHRRVTRAYLLEEDGQRPYATVEVVREFSRARYLANYVRRGQRPEDAALFGDQFPTTVSTDIPAHVVQYADDTTLGFGYRFALRPAVLPAEPVGNYTVTLPPGSRGVAQNRTSFLDPNRTLAGLYRPYLDPDAADWTVSSRNRSTVVLSVTEPTAVFRTVPMDAVAVHERSRVDLVLDARTGRPRRLVEHRVVTQRVDGEPTRRHYLLVSRYDRWGRATVDRPGWVGAPDLGTYLQDLLYY